MGFTLPTSSHLTNRAFIVVSATCAAVGAGIIVWATPWGIGLSPDSAVYIAGARSLGELKGYMQPADGTTFSPIVHYPPAYPASLAVLRVIGLDPFAAARCLNTVLFSVNAVLAGYLLFAVTRRWEWAAASAALMITAFPLVQVHTMVWSEPLFILLELCAWLFLLHYSRSLSLCNLICAGLAAGLAALTRYAGVAVILTGVLALIALIRTEWKRRIICVALFFLFSMLPVILWMGRNWLVAGSATNRTVAIHVIDFERIVGIFRTILSWLVGDLISAVPPALILCLAAGLGTWFALQVRKREFASARSETDYLRQSMLLFTFCYLFVLFFSISVLDDQTPIDSRILAPMYPVLLLFGFALVANSHGESRAPEMKLSASWAIVLLLVVLQAFQSWPWLYYVHSEGVGYASRTWRESNLLLQVKELAPSTIIYSNAPDVLYILAGRIAYMLPRKTRPDTREPNSQFSAQIDEMAAQLKNSRGAIVYFDQVRWRRYLPNGKELEGMLALRPLQRVSDGTIYTLE